MIGLKFLQINKTKVCQIWHSWVLPIYFRRYKIDKYIINKSINYAESFTTIEENAISAIKLARKSLLFSKDETSVKKSDNELFDVTMGSFNGAKICQLVGLYLLDKLSKLLANDNVGLYRDDALAAIKSIRSPVLDKMRKNIIALFKEEGITITIDTNLIKTDFLDVTFNLATGKFFPFRRPNNVPLYINVKSNYPSTIIKDLPKMINKRLPELSCNKDEFHKASRYTKNHCKKVGIKHQYHTLKQKSKPARIEVGIKFGSTHHSTKILKPILAKSF